VNDDLVRDLSGYTMSRDYRRLWNLAQVQSVVCVVDYGGGAQRDLDADPYVCRDVAHTICHSSWTPSGERAPSVNVSARGICYVGAMPEEGVEGFVRQAEAANLEWIVPAWICGCGDHHAADVDEHPDCGEARP